MSLQSMTGYASAQSTLVAEGSSEGARLGLEIRSVNSRFLDVSFRLPDELRQHEPALRELIGQHIKRGKVELRAYLEAAHNSTIAMPDKALLQKLVEIQQLVRGTMHDAALLSVAEVIRLSHGPMTPNQDWAPQVMALGQQAVTQLCEARQREGQRLAVDLLQRALQLQALADLALPLVPKTVENQRLRFLERWREAMALGRKFCSVNSAFGIHSCKSPFPQRSEGCLIWRPNSNQQIEPAWTHDSWVDCFDEVCCTNEKFSGASTKFGNGLQ